MKIQSYYQQEAQNQIIAERELALMMDRHQEQIDEARYWSRVYASEAEQDRDFSWDIN
ncbi:hypothetical protein [Pedobacter agri]|uniref:Uncharacterized protein n=1 Tax=Pedobacter agri TaxID=454586 RepID=A0A9X3DFL9_9SPHI|nr:hypothetical protein [Pedobacter agri]MCX3266589.1 hypothetical protein [Pedobacter agri]